MAKPGPNAKGSTDAPGRLKAAQDLAREAMKAEALAAERRATDVEILLDGPGPTR